MDGLRSYGLVLTFLFWLHGNCFSHVNISIATISWVDIVVCSPFRTLGMQPVINIQKGNWIFKRKKKKISVQLDGLWVLGSFLAMNA